MKKLRRSGAAALVLALAIPAFAGHTIPPRSVSTTWPPR